MILDPIVPLEPKYPFKLKVEVDWPRSIEHDGETYHFYHKTGVRVTDRCPCANYQCLNEDLDKRLWLGLDGKIEED